MSDKTQKCEVAQQPGPCPQCAAQAVGARFCANCGKALASAPAPVNAEPAPQAAPSPAPVPAVQPAADPVPANGFRCACGQDLPGGAAYCLRCGTRQKPAAPCVKLTWNGETTSGSHTHTFDRELLIGKQPGCDIALSPDDFASRRHARLYHVDDHLELEDLGSSNGTYIRLRHPVTVEPGDQILVGTTTIRIEKE